MRRRDLIRAMALAAPGAVLGCRAGGQRAATGASPGAPAGPAPRAAERPHHIVYIVLHGGYDSLLTFDPRRSEEVTEVDLETRTDELLRGRRRLYGPLFAPLMEHEQDLAIVHGVRVESAGHLQATYHLACGRVTTDPDHPAVGDVLGAALPGPAPIPHLVLGGGTRIFLCHSIGCEDRTIAARTGAAVLSYGQLLEIGAGNPPPRLLGAIREEQVEESRRVFPDPGDASRYALDAGNAVAMTDLVARATVHDGFSDTEWGRTLNAALEAIRLGSARFISVVCDGNLIDTHIENLKLQRRLLTPMLADLATFLRLLRATHNQHGSLVDQTTVVVGTEMGRYNRINMFAGRDHWPENSWVLFGRGIRRAPEGVTVGATDSLRRSQPIDFATGAPSRERGSFVFVESIFATLARAARLDVSAVGYRDQEVLGCLLDGTSTGAHA